MVSVSEDQKVSTEFKWYSGSVEIQTKVAWVPCLLEGLWKLCGGGDVWMRGWEKTDVVTGHLTRPPSEK